MENFKYIYDHLPYSLKVIAASIHGYKLKSWRYGRNTEELVSKALERESWSKKQWNDYQGSKLEEVLNHAYKNVPYYREAWDARRRNGDKSSHLILSNWPILTKEELRKYPQAFLADGIKFKDLYSEHTSGTTGTPLYLWCSREMLQEWYALVEARWRRWYGLSFNDHWGMLGGQLVTPTKRKKPPFWVWNQGLNQLYMSVVHIKPEWTNFYAKAITQHKIIYLYGYTSALFVLAQGLLEQGVNLPMKAVITNAEPLFDLQRSTINECFQCPVFETYGQAEMITAASECHNSTLHLWPEIGFSEILDENNFPQSNNQPGRLIGTSFLNLDMPLIRYDTLDLLTQEDEKSKCQCKHNLPIIKNVVGRNDDTILLRDGRKVFQIDTIFGSHLQIKEAQIIQETLDDFTIMVVPAPGFSHKDEKELKIELMKRLGQVNIEIIIVPQIERTWSGKFRIIISKVKFSGNF